MGLTNNNGLQHPMHHSETALGANNTGMNESRGGSKQGGTDASQSDADGQDGSAARHGSGDGKNEGN
ncbi:unnamed protein product [Arabis nemorensis]|uniref:Uncharacterized protein n=1 Tax=Arabis nemorensis TaxID=586526 RepID=A0A565BZV3_9BRAS|nr:unnamed protein product [Arabis nemorensis]